MSAKQLMFSNCCCWRRLLRVPWAARRSNQSILKDISPKCSLEGLMLKLKFQYFGHLMRTVGSLEKTLMLGEIEGKRTKGQQRMKCLDGITSSIDIILSKLQGYRGQRSPAYYTQSVGSQRVEHNLATEQQQMCGI